MKNETKTVQKELIQDQELKKKEEDSTKKKENELKRQQAIIKIKKKIIKVNSIGGFPPVKAETFVKIISKKLNLKEEDIDCIVCNFTGKLTEEVKFVITTTSGEEIYKNVLFSEFNIPEKMALYTAQCTRKKIVLDVEEDTEIEGIETSKSKKDDDEKFERIIQIIPRGNTYVFKTE